MGSYYVPWALIQIIANKKEYKNEINIQRFIDQLKQNRAITNDFEMQTEEEYWEMKAELAHERI